MQTRRSLMMKLRMNQQSTEHNASKSNHQSSLDECQKVMRTDHTGNSKFQMIPHSMYICSISFGLEAPSNRYITVFWDQ